MKLIGIAFVGVVFASGAVVTINHFWRGETLSTTTVEKKWGDAKFDAAKFKSGNETVRASMAS